jgi:hypothetical protein
MATIPGFTKRFQRIKIRQTIQEACRVSGFDIIQSIRAQMKRGERGDGQKISPRYSSITYAIDKQRKNPSPGFGIPDLYDTGAFQAGIYIKFGNYNFTIGSNDSKSPDLEAKYTTQIFATNQNTKRELVPKIYQRLFASLKQQMGLS